MKRLDGFSVGFVLDDSMLIAHLDTPLSTFVKVLCESMVHILGAFLDTLVLNVYPTDPDFQLEQRRLDPLL